ncbi:MAG: hypothetical protein KDK55_05025 [Chlamydiia bacterium]|nr:hypothetical protein [Chlamydiia bacterium]
MTRLGGIIYPTAYQMSDLFEMMSGAYGHDLGSSIFRYKNLEMGTLGGALSSNSRKSCWVACDGKLHNASSLKCELQNKGYHFVTSSESELIVHAYDAWGDRFISKLIGYFTIALFDEEIETLFLIRDRIGHKRLYWTSSGGYWMFASEIKALLATGVVPQTPAIDGIASYLFFGYTPQDLSPIRNVNKVLPGHLIKVNLKQQSTIEQFWSYSTLLEEKSHWTFEESLSSLSVRLDEAVISVIPPSGPFGTMIEPTLGSTAMAWSLSHLTSKGRIRGYTKHPKAQAIADILHIGTNTINFTPTQAFLELPQIVWQLDDPIADPRILCSWFLGKIASDETPTVFSAIGWEQVFAGKLAYFSNLGGKKEMESIAKKIAHLPSSIREGFFFLFLGFFHLRYKYEILRNLDINPLQIAYLHSMGLFTQNQRKKASPYLSRFFDPEVFTQRFHRLSKVQNSTDALLYFETKTYLPDSLLPMMDQIFNYYGLELMTPFLDHRLIEWMATCPIEIKCLNNIPGILLAQLLKKRTSEFDLLEPHIFPSPPQTAFIDEWRKDSLCRKMFSLLQQGCLVEEGLISAKWIKQQLGYPYMISSSFCQLWAILILEIWFRLNIISPIGHSSLPVSTEELLS